MQLKAKKLSSLKEYKVKCLSSLLKGAELCGELHSGIPELGLELGFEPKENGSGSYLLRLFEDDEEDDEDDEDEDEEEEEDEEDEDEEDEEEDEEDDGDEGEK